MKKIIRKSVFVLIGFLILLVNLNLTLSLSELTSFGGTYYTPSFTGSYRIVGTSANPQFSDPNFLNAAGFTSPGMYFSEYDKEDCYERQDFVMQIAPGGCSPAVVRSDLLEEQPVPVFCKVMAVQLNPLIDVSRIRSLRFPTKNLSVGVSSISYFPAQAALRSRSSLISSPVNDNLGYLVIVLSRQEVEDDMPDFVEGNVTAVIDYDAQGAFGIGKTSFYSLELSNEDWARDYLDYSFWNGKGYIRTESIEEDHATIAIYRDRDVKQSTVTLRKGETSKDLFLGGFYCAAGMNIRLESIDAPVSSALLKVNEQEIWVADNDRILDDKCRVTSLDLYGAGGRVSIDCPVKDGKFDLTLSPGKVSLNVDGNEKEYAMGDKVDKNDNFSYWIAYNGKDKDNNEFVIIVRENASATSTSASRSPVEFSERKIYSLIYDKLKDSKLSVGDDKFREAVEDAVKKGYKTSERKDIKTIILSLGPKKTTATDSESGITLIESLAIKNRAWKDGESKGREYYENATKTYQDLLDFYPDETSVSEKDSYAALGLYKAAVLAKEHEMYEDAYDFYTSLLNKYPNSDIALKAVREKELLSEYDSSDSRALVYVNNEEYFVEVIDFKKPDKDDLSAVLRIKGETLNVEETLGLGEIYQVGKETIQIKEIKDEYILIEYTEKVENTEKIRSKKLLTGERDNQFSVNNYMIRLVKINLNKQVKLSIEPKARGPRTESDFTFKIGIEKRGIDLSPDKTKERIEELDEKIEKWDSINDRLGNAVKALKGACFATSAMLTVKNLFSGVGGESMARQEVMTASGGWNDYCENLVNKASYTSVQSCLVDKNDDIEADVKAYAEKISDVNAELEKIQNKVGVDKSDFLDMQGQVDAKHVEGNFSLEYKKFCNDKSGNIQLNDASKTTMNFGSGGSGTNICDMGSFEQQRDIMRDKMILDSVDTNSRLYNISYNNLQKTLGSAKEYYDYEQKKLVADNLSKQYNLGIRSINPIGDNIAYADVKTVTSSEAGNHQVYSNFKANDDVVRVFIPAAQTFGNQKFEAPAEIAGKEVIVKVKDNGQGIYSPDISEKGGVYLVEGGKQVSASAINNVTDYMSLAKISRIKEADSKAYINPIINKHNLKVKYFERAPYKGMPSFVPFDTKEGWYVQMTYVLSGFGKPYDESGRAVNYYICNVGGNGIPEFKKSGDDICRYYNGNTADLNFPGMSSGDSRMLVSRAQQAISEAGRQYGKDKIKIGGEVFDSAIDFGGEEGRCTDFMSPDDCNLLFNVCDPVICPASRCDLGGKYRVDNVIQSGIIGSLLLCLPNANEGIKVPICLSGVHAGIDGYLSILKSARECLNESLETGRHVGICDEITSIYTCQFFWRQASPFLNVLIPRIAETFYKQGARGGGEYLTVQSAWDNTQASINYFKNDYAVNSMEAFNRRSTDSIGDDVCKSFMSIRYPNSGDFFDDLIEPDSPVQYHAWFSEDPLTTATIPATSHYKVYYHIYAGKDQGAQYVVYLEDLPESNYIHSSGRYIVDTGYAPRGGSVDKAEDFTTVAGYKQLCISVNGQEECGFGKVSTSYFVNTLSDMYAEEQLKTGIEKESECIAGTASFISLAQPNLQAGLGDVVQPDLYNSGIIRVCSTENPGKQVMDNGMYDTTASTYDRWKDVGYCDDSKIRCWVDTDSVKNVVKNTDTEDRILQEFDLSILGEEGILGNDISIGLASEGEKFVDNLETVKKENIPSSEKILGIIQKLEKLSNAGINNNFRARGLYLLARLYGALAKKELPEKKKIDEPPEVDKQELERRNLEIRKVEIEGELSRFPDGASYDEPIQEEINKLKTELSEINEKLGIIDEQEDAAASGAEVSTDVATSEGYEVIEKVVIVYDKNLLTEEEIKFYIGKWGEASALTLSSDGFAYMEDEKKGLVKFDDKVWNYKISFDNEDATIELVEQ